LKVHAIQETHWIFGLGIERDRERKEERQSWRISYSI